MGKTRSWLAAAAVALFAAGAHAAELDVPLGYRAVVMPVSKAEFLFIKPGSRLDMTVTFTAVMKDDRKELITATMLQNLLVLDTVDKGGVRAVVLALNPNEAQYAELSLSEGYRINFTVRAKGDMELHPMEIASFRRLIRGGEEDKDAGKDKPAKQ